MRDPSQWCHNELNGISNHQCLDCLLNRVFRHRSKKTSKLRITGLCEGNSLVNSPHKGPVTRKMFPFDDIIMPCIRRSWGHFTNDFCIIIQIQWKIGFKCNCTMGYHITTKFEMITLQQLRWQQNEISIAIELQWQNSLNRAITVLVNVLVLNGTRQSKG